jgi:hypothetical protein
LVVTENTTLDGVIEATGDWFDPAGDDAEVDQLDVVAASGSRARPRMRCSSGE